MISPVITQLWLDLFAEGIAFL